MRVPGFEPGAYRLGGGRSILLSYTRSFFEGSVYQRFMVGVFGFMGHRRVLDLGVVCKLCAKRSRIQTPHRILEVHPPVDRTVAIKVLLAHVADDPDLRQRFEREAKTISSLNSYPKTSHASAFTSSTTSEMGMSQ